MQTIKKPEDTTIFNAKLKFRNFGGTFDPTRSFSIDLSPEVGERLIQDGWYVNVKEPPYEGADPIYTLKVKVSYKYKKPKIEVIVNGSKRPYGEDEIYKLDAIPIQTADVTITGSVYNNVQGRSGVSTYLSHLVIVEKEDELDKKYRDVPWYEAPNDEG